MGPGTGRPFTTHRLSSPAGAVRRGPRSTAERIRRTHPGLDVVAQELCGEPATVLCGAAEESELLVFGSRGLGGVAGFVSGLVALSVVARTRHPVVLVPGRAPIPNGGIVLGLDLSHPCDEVLDHAFSRAHRLGPHTGGMTRTVLHHCRTPVAVIPHD
ncbi:universal stress protein [Streptomyces sp. NPDC058892]|uniref:universal stress protein n=1 Tax=unclassified Streptomyces TaxID=2593676 RepID=UPI0036D0646C